MTAGRRLQLAAVTLALIAYSLLSHYSHSHLAMRALATALALAPMLCVGCALAVRVGGAAAALPATLAAALLAYLFWPLLMRNFALLYLCEQAGFYAILAFGFARSLRPGRSPVCTQLADRIHGPLTALELRYTRQVTVAWEIFFLLNLLASFAWFAFAPLAVWALYVDFCSLPLILAMFAAELVVRRRVLPPGPRSGLIDTLRVYFASPR